MSDWKTAQAKVNAAFDALVQIGRDEPQQLGPYGTCRVITLPGGLECRVTVARSPQPGEIRI